MKHPNFPARTSRTLVSLAALVVTGLVAQACGDPPSTGSDNVPNHIEQAVMASDRSAADRERDAERKPAQMLTFARVSGASQVLELGAGSGYTTELLARILALGAEENIDGPVVYAQNTREVLEKYVKGAFDARMKNPHMAIVRPVVRPYADPVPAGAKDLGAVLAVFVYHDLVADGLDRAGMNRAVFEVMDNGGFYTIVDHAGNPEFTEQRNGQLHRVTEDQVIREVEAAGFELVERGDFLRYPDDPRDQAFFEREEPVDQFALRFVKP